MEGAVGHEAVCLMHSFIVYVNQPKALVAISCYPIVIPSNCLMNRPSRPRGEFWEVRRGGKEAIQIEVVEGFD